MKKKCLLILFLCVINLTVFAFEFRWGLGCVSIGGEINREINAIFDAKIVDFALAADNGIYLYYSPFNYTCQINKDSENNNHREYFLNLGLGYDFFRFNKQIELLPFLEAHYLALEGIEKYKFESGICLKIFSRSSFSESAELYKMKGEILNIKSGLSFQDETPSFYFSIGTDLLNLLMMMWGS